MNNKNNSTDNNNPIGDMDGEQAYKTLVDWVKTVPVAMQEIKNNGSEENLKKYKLQIKMVVEKLKEIEKKLFNEK